MVPVAAEAQPPISSDPVTSAVAAKCLALRTRYFNEVCMAVCVGTAVPKLSGETCAVARKREYGRKRLCTLSSNYVARCRRIPTCAHGGDSQSCGECRFNGSLARLGIVLKCNGCRQEEQD